MVAPLVSAQRGVVALVPTLYRCDSSGAVLADLTDLVTGGKVTCNLDAPQPLVFTATLRLPLALTPFVDYVQPWLQVGWADGTVIRAPIGFYAVPPPPKTHQSGYSLATIDGRDLTWLLASRTFRDGYSVGAGANLASALQSVVTGAGITRQTIPASSATAASAISWPPGTTRLKVANDLAAGLGWYDLSTDTAGYVTSQPALALDQVGVSAIYSSGAGSRVVGQIDETPDLSRLANVVTVRRVQANSPTLSSTAVNSSPANPTSTAVIGEWARTFDEPGLADQVTADALARRYLSEGASYSRGLRLRTAPDPTAGVHDVVALEASNPDGVVATGAWWRRGWVLGFTPKDGPMEHTLNRVEAYQ